MKRESTVIKRRRRDMCKRHEPMPEIPFELVVEILTRLPAKSLMKFKSVSKLWLSVICSRYFTERFQRVASSPPRLYMCGHFVDNGHLKRMVLSSSPSYDSDGASMSSFDADQDLTIPAMTGYGLSDVFRGLMCFFNGPSVQIYNTTSRQLVVLPDIEESRLIAEYHKIMCHVGHDLVHDRYKVVWIAASASGDTYLSEHWVFLLEGDGSSRWKKISCGFPPHLPMDQALNINGRMHYIAIVGMDFVLVVFDISSEEFSMLQLPNQDTIWLVSGLIEYCGKIAFLNIWNLENDGVVELWVMEDEETNMWGLKTLVLHPSQRHMVNSIHLTVLGTTPNGEVILKSLGANIFNIFLYDLQKNHMRNIVINASPHSYLTVLGMEDVENLIYL